MVFPSRTGGSMPAEWSEGERAKRSRAKGKLGADTPAALERQRLAALSDQALGKAIAENIPFAIGELLRRYRAPLKRFASLIGVDPDDVDPVVNEVIEETASALMEHRARPPLKLAEYLRGAVRNRLLRKLRSRERERSVMEQAYGDLSSRTAM